MIHFKSSDEYNFGFGCASKVWLCRHTDGLGRIGYVIAGNSNDEQKQVRVEGSGDLITLPFPTYNSDEERYNLISSDEYLFVDYWPVRIKVTRQGLMYMMMNRVLFEYTYNTELIFESITINSDNINNVIKLLWVFGILSMIGLGARFLYQNTSDYLSSTLVTSIESSTAPLKVNKSS